MDQLDYKWRIPSCHYAPLGNLAISSYPAFLTTCQSPLFECQYVSSWWNVETFSNLWNKSNAQDCEVMSSYAPVVKCNLMVDRRYVILNRWYIWIEILGQVVVVESWPCFAWFECGAYSDRGVHYFRDPPYLLCLGDTPFAKCPEILHKEVQK